MQPEERSICALIVDDDQVCTRRLSAALESSGIKSIREHDASRVLKEIDQLDIQIVLLDIEMPEMSGLEILKELRKSRSAFELPVIMISAHSDSETIVEALRLGANDYLTKPFRNEIVAARVNNTLRLKEFHQLQLKHSETESVTSLICTYNHEINSPLQAASQALDKGDSDHLRESLQNIETIMQRIEELKDKIPTTTTYVSGSKTQLYNLKY